MKNNEKLCQISKILIWINTPMTKPDLRKSITVLARMDVDLKMLCSIIYDTLDKYSEKNKIIS